MFGKMFSLSFVFAQAFDYLDSWRGSEGGRSTASGAHGLLLATGRCSCSISLRCTQ